MSIFENLQMGATVGNPDDFDDDLQKVYELFPILRKRSTQRGGNIIWW